MSTTTNNVTVSWSWEDVQCLRPEWTKEQCQEALDKISEPLQDRSIEMGWDIMEILLNLECNKK